MWVLWMGWLLVAEAPAPALFLVSIGGGGGRLIGGGGGYLLAQCCWLPGLPVEMVVLARERSIDCAFECSFRWIS